MTPRPSEMNQRPRVFVVDDDEAILTLLEALLQQAGYEVEIYTSARAFLDSAVLTPPCCVVLDVNMPEMTGLEVFASLRRSWRPVAVIFMTAERNALCAVEAMLMGAIDFLVKPFKKPDLLAAVRTALKRSGEHLKQAEKAAQARAKLTQLTDHERRVCELVAAGLLTRQVADLLGGTERGVRAQQARAMRKLGIDTLEALMRIVDAARRG